MEACCDNLSVNHARRSRSPVGRPHFRSQPVQHWLSSASSTLGHLLLCGTIALSQTVALGGHWPVDAHGNRLAGLLGDGLDLPSHFFTSAKI